MITVSRIKDLRAAIQQQKQARKRVAFVPTMGNLHAGHISLVKRAHEMADYVVTSIFVNPLQFGAHEDLDKYPRTLDADKAQLVNAGNHALYTPTATQIYPKGLEQHTKVIVPGITESHCGASRPGHFTGVSTVVNILFNLVQPDIALFGEKDYQQVAVIRKMVKDLGMPIQIETVATMREPSGLAMSSRNGYLSAAEKQTAAKIYKLLKDMASRIEKGARDYDSLILAGKATLADVGFEVDYLSIAQSDTLAPAKPEDSEITLLVAAKLGSTRLIDNISISLSTS
ncbi:MAG: pantoate--beta-alanine ligase [Hahellaceae bacterium]|jgi:pantoate--beta-alanine ligase|nr:pantoate--beta-alanine ligase [Hahellaceae bacterium]